ncbi:related to Pre-rRNA-processing protein RIX1 [Zygosaccharomyces bailii ISA1307]|nr:related to Pre-rRNA-processing protein RIX1 [Zygosaccharomyces bailii ISA1307]
MNSERFPLPALAKELESCQESQFGWILKKLASPDYIDEQLLKSDIALVVAKISKLLRSNEDYNVWKGCHAAVVFCSHNPLVLCCHSGQLLTIIYSKLEQKLEYHSSSTQNICNKIILDSLVFATSKIIELMRNKPTLSREHLVPKLKAIIPCLIRITPSKPELCLPVLKSLLLHHSTTFRPFATKYRQVLADLICKEYTNFSEKVQILVCDNYAYLHLIKLQAKGSQDDSQSHHKSFQDETWRIGILSILTQFKPVLELCDEIVELDHDQDLRNIIKTLIFDNLYETDLPTIDKDLPGLKVDLNEPTTLREIPRRLHLLIDLLLPFLSLSTPYPVRIPLNACLSLFEALLSLTKNFLPLKREIRRDAELVSVVTDILPCIQFAGIRLITVMVETFGKCCVSMLPSILGSLEYFIPIHQKTKTVDIKKCKLMDSEFLHFFHLLNVLFPHIGHQMLEFGLFSKVIEVALSLLEVVNPVDYLTNQKPNCMPSSKNGLKKQKRENSLGALSDMYTHSEPFVIDIPFTLYGEVNMLFRGLLSNWKLPSTEQCKIIRYSISNSLKFRQDYGYIPSSFVQLLRTEVIYPGNERVSILPIAISLLKGSCDEIFDLLCHPRLPMGMIYHTNKPVDLAQEELNEEEHGSAVDLENHADMAEAGNDSTHATKDEFNIKEDLKRSKVEPTVQSPKRQKLKKDIPLFQNQKIEILEKHEEGSFIAKQNETETTETTEAKNQVKNIEKFSSHSLMGEEYKQGSSPESDTEFVIPQIALSDDDEDS